MTVHVKAHGPTGAEIDIEAPAQICGACQADQKRWFRLGAWVCVYCEHAAMGAIFAPKRDGWMLVHSVAEPRFREVALQAANLPLAGDRVRH